MKKRRLRRVVMISSKYPLPPRDAANLANAESAFDQVRVFSQGGLGMHVARLASAVADVGCEVKVFAYSPGLDSVTKEGNITICRLSMGEGRELDPLERDGQAMLESRFLSRVQELVLKTNEPPDVIHCHHFAAFRAACQLHQLTQAPIVSTVHFLAFGQNGAKADGFPESARETEAAMCRNSQRLIAVSKWMKGVIRSTLEVDPAYIDVVYNGIDGEEIDTGKENAASERIRLAPCNEKIVIYAGRISSEKGLSVFLEAADLVLRERSDVVYVIAGGGPNEIQSLQTEIAQHPMLSGKVHFTGWVEQEHLKALYAASDIAVVPSTYESFGYAALEAMVSSTSVIVSNAGGLPEIVTHNRTGMVIPLRSINGGLQVDSAELSRAQLRLLRDATLRRSLGLRGRNRALKEFSMTRMLHRTLAVYRKALRLPASQQAQEVSFARTQTV